MPSRGPSRPAATYGAFAACTLIWGSTFLVIAFGNDTMPPVWAATLRLGLAAPILTLASFATRQGLPRGRALAAAAWLGLFQFGCNFPLLYWGETVVPSSMAAILFATIPLTSALLARAFGLESLNASRIGGALVALAGVAIIFSGELSNRVALPPLLAVLAATLFGCLGTMIYKKGPRQSAIGANAVATAVGCVVCLLVSVAAGESLVAPRTWAQFLPILYLTLAGSVGAFVIFAWLVGHWDVTKASYISVVTPLVALLLGAAVRHERLTPTRLLGSAIVLAGVAVGLGLWRRPETGSGAASREAA